MEVGKNRGITSVTVHVPHRISGFFEIVDRKMAPNHGIDDLCRIGSRGGGPCLSALGKTTVSLNEPGTGLRVFINGIDKTREALTTRSVVSLMEQFIAKNDKTTLDLDVFHEFPLPTGAGYGSSGCGAIGTAVGLNFLWNLGLCLDECGKFAHCAEVKNKTGLGTVGGQIRGGCTITVEPGFPFGTRVIIIPPGYAITCASRGGILTSEILTDPGYRQRIIKAGRVAMKRIEANFTLENFMETSISYVHATGMLRIEELDLGGVKNAMDELNGGRVKGVLGASMNQLGKSIFCIHEDIPEVNQRVEEIINDQDFPAVQHLEFAHHGPLVNAIRSDN